MEFLLRRYGDISYILRMDFTDFLEFYNLAKEKEKEERIFAQWVVQLPFMTQEKFISFPEYKDKLLAKNIDLRSTEALLNEISDIERKLSERG